MKLLKDHPPTAYVISGIRSRGPAILADISAHRYNGRMQSPEPSERTVALPDPAATEALARRLAPLARARDVILLHGALGMGKSLFARAFIRARTHPREEVPSPTFTLVQIYDGAPTALWHFDLYRLSDPQEAIELDIEDAFAEAISLIEWPDRLKHLTPAERLDVRFSQGPAPDARYAHLRAHGADWAGRLGTIGA